MNELLSKKKKLNKEILDVLLKYVIFYSKFKIIKNNLKLK